MNQRVSRRRDKNVPLPQAAGTAFGCLIRFHDEIGAGLWEGQHLLRHLSHPRRKAQFNFISLLTASRKFD